MSLWVVLIVGLVFGAQPGWGYEEMAVTNGGTIKGTVFLAGGRPRPMAFNLVTIPDPVFCGRISTGTGWRLVDDFIIGPQGTLKDVVVMLKGVHKGKAFHVPEVEIKAKDCEFLPFVNVLRDKDQISIVNVDPVEHDMQGYETARKRGARVMFNTPLPMNKFFQMAGKMAGAFGPKYLAGKPIVEKIHLRKGRDVFVMQCGFHPYMFTWGMVVKNPYYAITKADGTFTLTNVPPGEYTLTAWHPGVKKFVDQQVTVMPQGVTTSNFTFQSPKGRRSVHEMVDNPRFGLEMLGEDMKIVPSLRVQKP